MSKKLADIIKAIASRETQTNLPHVNRVEVIDHSGRAYVLWQDNMHVSYQLQDEGRTFKIFIKGSKPDRIPFDM